LSNYEETVISTKIHQMQSVTQGIVGMSIYVFFTVNLTVFYCNIT